MALLGLLFSPLLIRVNTWQQLYQLRWGLARVQFIPAEDGGCIRFCYGFWQRDYPLWKLGAKLATAPQPGVPPKLPKRIRKKGAGFFTLRRLRRVLRTFRLHFFYLDVDTDDFVRNAYWYPVFRAFSTPTRKLSINFAGRNQCAFELSNRVFDLLMALVF